MGEFAVGVASAAEVRVIVQWAAAEGWNPGAWDENIFFAGDPNAFLVGRLDGRAVTSIAAIRYGEKHGFIGLYLTVPQWRGHGYGRRVWQAGMERLAGRNVGLDGVPLQQENYRRSGFRTSWNTVRYRGRIDRIETAPGVTVVDARSIGFADLAAYDRRFFPADRDAFLALWISAPKHRALAALRDGELAGFAVRRPAGDTARIGPLYAESPDIAAHLLSVLAMSEGDAPILLDVPDVNWSGVTLAEKFALTPCFETARMYTGGTPDIEIPHIFGTTTREFG
ncbi:GNAT family N-acetyltransferase [Actinoplanes sp. NPDC051851]|uniref:GNAT family N-acetyltransferase n=1 Tax=Actinoplanes sp. NPDC051851 TaxID=3154753 RepID=UPI003426B1AD